MPANLPPLTALRAFEAAARHLSLKQAAAELSVTPAAVSHQIQQLEDLLGVRLFRRRHRGVELTEIAQACLPRLQEGFESLRQAVDRIRVHRGADVLTVGASPSFASHWLMRRLHRFVIANPEVDVRVTTQMRQFARLPRGRRGDLESVLTWVDEVDVIVVFGNGNYPGLRVDKLLPLEITPLCSPALIDGEQPLRAPEHLVHHILLHDDRGILYEGRSFWDIWLDAAGARGLDTHRGPHFTHAILAIEAAMAGLGVTVSTPALASADLATGRLVAPFELRMPLESSYYVVSNDLVSRRSVIGLFRDWLMSEAQTVMLNNGFSPRS
jgi:LysR family glycine cleavage system transcriptional activator